MRNVRHLGMAAMALLYPMTDAGIDTVLTALGLDRATSTDEQAEGVLENMMSEAEALELEQRAASAEDALTNRDIKDLGLTDAGEIETARALLNAAPDREKALAFLANRKPAPAPRPSLTNRNLAKTPVTEETKAAAKSSEAGALHNRARAIQVAEKIPWSAAWQRAKAEQKGDS